QPIRSSVGDRSRVAELGADRGSLCVYSVGELAQADHSFLAHPDLVTVRAALRGNGAVGDRGHADAAAGGPQVVIDRPGRDQGMWCTALEGGSLDDTIAQPQRTQLRWRIHIRNGAPVIAHRAQRLPHRPSRPATSVEWNMFESEDSTIP